MKNITLMRTFITALALVVAVPVFAQDSSDDADVWRVVSEQWQRSQDGDNDWVEELLAEDFSGWGNDSPAPRDKESTTMWQKFESKQFDGRVHELYPLSIIVHGDMAVAHYLYTNAGENADGDIVTTNGRYTDVLVRVDGQWVFIAWHGGSDDSD
jgi:ketosteroid isomerase-like protein